MDDPDNRGEVARFVHERKVSYPILLNEDTVSDSYGGVHFLPQTFFIDRDGKVLEITAGVNGRQDLEAHVRRALGLPLG